MPSVNISNTVRPFIEHFPAQASSEPTARLPTLNVVVEHDNAQRVLEQEPPLTLEPSFMCLVLFPYVGNSVDTYGVVALVDEGEGIELAFAEPYFFFART